MVRMEGVEVKQGNDGGSPGTGLTCAVVTEERIKEKDNV